MLGLPGAVADHAGVPAHYGDPFGEQRRLAAGLAVVDRSDLAVLRVSGADRLGWLDSLTSQRLTGLPPGGSAETLLLDPAGRVEHAIAVLDDGEASWLIVEAGEAASLSAFLDRMRFLLRVEVEAVSGRYAVLATLGAPGDLPAAAPAGVPLVWHDPWQHGAAGGTTAAAAPHPAAGWHCSLVVVERAGLSVVVARVRRGDLAAAGLLAFEALRIAAWRPRSGSEVDERTIPHELDWLRSAVHLNKGCYRGQETVAKVHNLGRPPRRLVQLDLDGSVGIFAAPGDAVLLVQPDGEEREVGRVTSAAQHFELGPVALAVVKRSVPETAPLLVATEGSRIAAGQQVVVPADGAPAVAVPRIPRLGSRRD